MSALHMVEDSDRGDWLEWRRGGIGASEAAAVAGFSPFDSPTSIYLKKIGFLRESEGQEEDWQRAGRLLEPVIARWFEEETGYQVRSPQLRLMHADRPWQRATLDGVVFIDGQPAGPFESKSTLRWNREWRAEPPDYYQAQLLHQMVVMGARRGWIATLIDGRRFRWWEIQRNDLDADMLTSVEAAFWRRVIERRPPPVDGSEPTHEALATAFKEPVQPEVELDVHGLELVMDLREARDARLAAEKAETAAQNKVLALLSGAEVATWKDQPAVKWALHERTTVDLDALRALYGELPTKTTNYRQFWLPKESQRHGND